MNSPISRRELFAASPLALAACASRGEYFGRAEPPHEQRLTFQLGAEPDTLDPTMSEAGSEEFILPSLFEGLLTLHPVTAEVLPAIATHYSSNLSHTHFIFYLRGHRQPAGIRLSGAPVHCEPARWSDGRVITAHDFVYSWRRAVNPQTAAPMANLLYCIRNAEEVSRGQRPVEALAVRAIDDFTLQVEMRSSTPYFLDLHDSFVYYAVPAHVVEREGPSWTLPEHLVSSGPFQLTAWKAHDAIQLTKNPYHYDASSVQLQQINLMSVSNSSASINLYKAGACDWVPGILLPPVLVPSFQRKKDFHTVPAFWCMFYSINTKLEPFNNVLVRYALNMATDKRAIASFLNAGRNPALSLMPPFHGYPAVKSLPVDIEGTAYDVLEYNPAAARELLRKAGVGPLRIEIQYPNRPATADLPQILQQQWRQTLGADVIPVAQEEKVWIQARGALAYRGVAERGWVADYLDPNAFLEVFLAGPNVSGAGWSDLHYDTMLAEANAETMLDERMRKLAECERHVLRQMPILPLYYNVFASLRKPYVRGFNPGRLGLVRFKHVWLDTKWRPV
jgi:oligopeptide transport system substrate-binding protein